MNTKTDWHKAPKGPDCGVCRDEYVHGTPVRLVYEEQLGLIWWCPRCGCWYHFYEDYTI